MLDCSAPRWAGSQSVSAITCRRDGIAYGTTASAISSLSDDPQMLLVCLNGASATGIAVAAGTFATDVLAHEQAGLARRLATKTLTSSRES
jgi:4-nitrophenol 2-monooxygenase / 4-nitrocatechol 4-monooxygenase, reductase component